MKAMILAAGEGRRMRPLTNTTPKPLLRVSGRPLIEHHIVRLRDAGFSEIVVNVSYFGQQLVDFLGAGDQWSVAISVSMEASPLETAGGVIQALPLLGDEPFALVNGDIFTDYPFADLCDISPAADGAHIVLVPNPAHHVKGDFALNGRRVEAPNLVGRPYQKRPKRETTISPTATYSGIGVYDPALFTTCAPGKRPLKPLLDGAIAGGTLSGELYQGMWEDVGTPERLAQLNRRFPSDSVNQ